MTLAATMESSVALASQSAILGYLQSALVCTPRCFRKCRGQDEETAFSRNCCAADGNIGSGPIFYSPCDRNSQRLRGVSTTQVIILAKDSPNFHCSGNKAPGTFVKKKAKESEEWMYSFVVLELGPHGMAIERTMQVIIHKHSKSR